MANLDVAEVTRVATEAARQTSTDLEVVGVTLGAGGAEYVEVILNIRGCHQEPCQVALGVFRNHTVPALHNEIATKLREHLREHRGH